MVFDIIGVLEDGDNRRSGVPINPRRTLSLPRGSDLKVRATIVRAGGSKVDLVEAAASLTFSVKKHPEDSVALVSRVGLQPVPLAPVGRMDFDLVIQDTRNLTFGRYLWDLAGTLYGKRESLIPLSPFLVEPNVGAPGAPTTSVTPVIIIGGGVATGIYSCPAPVSINDAVYESGINFVDKADATAIGTVPAIGFVLSKPTPTSAIVQYDGELSGFSGLVAGMTYFLSTTAGLIAKVGDAGFPTLLTQVVQRVGFAKNPSTLVVETDRDFIVL